MTPAHSSSLVIVSRSTVNTWKYEDGTANIVVFSKLCFCNSRKRFLQLKSENFKSGIYNYIILCTVYRFQCGITMW